MTFEEATARHAEVRHMMAAADTAYYDLDDPIMDDAVYDDHKREIARLEAAFPALVTPDSPTQKVSGTATSAFEKVKHRQRMESLDNSFTPAEVAEWAAPFPDECVIGELKMDGLSLSLTYVDGYLTQAATRGDGEVGEDVTHTARETIGVPLVIPTGEEYRRGNPEIVEVRGEVYLPKERFDEINAEIAAGTRKGKPLVNCRNGAAGGLRQKDPAVTRDRGIRFMAFGVSDATMPEVEEDTEVLAILEHLGFDVVPHFVLAAGSPAVAFEAQATKYAANRPNLPFDIDGIVYKLNSRAARKRLGSTSKAPRWATAYKFPAEQRKAHLRDIIVQTGRTGAVTPVALLDPVFVGGVTVARVTLHNADEIARLHLVPGAGVIVQRAGDVIPQIVGLDPDAPVVKGIYTFPDTCPSCGSKTIKPEDEAVRRCVNSAACPAQRQAHLEHFVSRAAFNIDGLGPSQIEDLIRVLELSTASQIMSLPDLRLADFRYDTIDRTDDECSVAEAMETWKGYGKGSVKKLMIAIKKARKVQLDRFIFALGIRNVGASTSKDIAKFLGTVDNFFQCISKDDGFALAGVETIDGVGPVVIASLDKHFSTKANYDEAFALRLACDITDMPKVSESAIQPLKGEVVCFTGSLDRWSRDQASVIAAELGAKVINSAAKSTTILVCGGNVGAKKIEAAEKNGATPQDEAWFIGVVEDAISQGYVLDVMD